MTFTKAYSDLVERILFSGYTYPDPNRKGVTRKEIFPAVITHNMQESFPLLTTKRMFTRGIFIELKWMLLGRTDLNFLREHGIKNIWDKDAYNHALKNKFQGTMEEFLSDVDNGNLFSLGPIYGRQYRNAGGVDQLLNVINTLLDPEQRYSTSLIINSWIPQDLHKMALPPCHHEMQFNCRPDENGDHYLDLQFSMRSSDVILGLPWNFAFYGMLLEIIAKMTGLRPGILTYFGKKVHLYNNQFEAAKETVNRTNVPNNLNLSEPVVVITLEDALLQESYNSASLSALINSMNLDTVKFEGYVNMGDLINKPEMLAHNS
jgi:thymidylate synthase